MKINTTILLLSALLLGGCYGAIRGKVVDAETGAPIEGAVAMAEWTRTKGLGNTYTVSAKVVEAVSDMEGNFELEGCYRPFVNEPDLTIYKKGYVAWNNVLIFPSYKVREGFNWKNGSVFKMERFKEEYSYGEHVSFIRKSINSTMAHGEKILIRNAIGEEVDLAREKLPQTRGGER